MLQPKDNLSRNFVLSLLEKHLYRKPRQVLDRHSNVCVSAVNIHNTCSWSMTVQCVPPLPLADRKFSSKRGYMKPLNWNWRYHGLWFSYDNDIHDPQKSTNHDTTCLDSFMLQWLVSTGVTIVFFCSRTLKMNRSETLWLFGSASQPAFQPPQNTDNSGTESTHLVWSSSWVLKHPVHSPLLRSSHWISTQRKAKKLLITYISVAVTAKKRFFLLWWKTLTKLPFLLKWLKHMLKHLNVYVIAFLPCKTPQSPPQGSKLKQVEKYMTHLWKLQPRHTLLVWYGNYCCYPDVIKAYIWWTHFLQVLRNEWLTTGTFPPKIKPNTLE